jgi:hypothetical protein
VAGIGFGNYNKIKCFMADFGSERSLLPGRGIVTNPKGEKPDSDHPHEDDLPLELHPEQEELSADGDELPVVDASLSGSIEEFHFSGPVEELDFTEPADFTFPTEQPADVATGQSGELAAAEPAEAESFFGAEGFGAEASANAESFLQPDAAVESETAGEGIVDLEPSADKPEPKPKFQLPGWVRTVEWVLVSLLAVAAVVGVAVSIAWDKDPKQVTLTLNIACPLALGLIAYSLWRSSTRWTTPAASAVYTVMLALSTAALIVGVWFQGIELSHYDWQFSKARVKAGMPPRVVLPVPTSSAEASKIEPPPAQKEPEAAAAKDSVEPAPAKDSTEAAPAPAKGSAEPAK